MEDVCCSEVPPPFLGTVNYWEPSTGNREVTTESFQTCDSDESHLLLAALVSVDRMFSVTEHHP